MRAADALGGMVTSPVRTLHRMTREGAPVWPPVVLMLAVTSLVSLKGLMRLTMLLDAGGAVVMRRMRDVYVDALRVDATLLVVTAVVLAVLARLLAPGRVLPARAAAAAAWLLIPLALLKSVGGVLEAVGLDPWWLPHHAVDSWAVIVKRQVDWGRFAIKCATAYGLPLALALALVARLRGAAHIFSEPPLRRGRAGLVLVGAALIVLAGAEAWSAVRAFERLRPVLVGDPLPDASLRILDSDGVGTRRAQLARYRGQVLLLDFWASWCAPCRRSMPELSTLATELEGRGLAVLGVNREPYDIPAATRALAELKPSFQSAVDERGYGDRIGLTSLPTSYVVDREGVVRHIHFGAPDAAVLRAEVEALLGDGTETGRGVDAAGPGPPPEEPRRP